ncbi:Proto-oncogene -like protein [Halotydeus destructor]|nr:Proto-oncogene -like protein [Halotydeus destructor]
MFSYSSSYPLTSDVMTQEKVTHDRLKFTCAPSGEERPFEPAARTYLPCAYQYANASEPSVSPTTSSTPDPSWEAMYAQSLAEVPTFTDNRPQSYHLQPHLQPHHPNHHHHPSYQVANQPQSNRCYFDNQLTTSSHTSPTVPYESPYTGFTYTGDQGTDDTVMADDDDQDDEEDDDDGSLSQLVYRSHLVKQELKSTLIGRNKATPSFADSLTMVNFRSSCPAAPEEEERRRRRRERNKVAATKCRHKKKAHVHKLGIEQEHLESGNLSLRKELFELDQEKNRLLRMLDSHRPFCIHNQSVNYHCQEFNVS